MNIVYDKIGDGYSTYRTPDPRIASAITIALRDAKSVLNVGAGSGSYEPPNREVIAVEPSAQMVSQRERNAAPAVRANAEELPFADSSFDVAMAILTIHHWADLAAGLNEMKRVARDRLVILTFDPGGPYFWLADYLPEIIEHDQPIMPSLAQLQKILGNINIAEVPVPYDCTDGFLGAYWRRPSAYLDEKRRAAISTFAMLADLSPSLKKLEDDLESGAWERRYGDLLAKDSLDIGYRLVTIDL